MNKYRIELVTKETADEFFIGGYNYIRTVKIIKAESKEDATILAHNIFDDDYVVLDQRIKTVEEYEEKEKALKKAIEEMHEKERKAKEKREKTKQAKADAMSLTIEQYKHYVSLKGKISACKNRIEEYEQALEKDKKALERMNKEMENYIK